MNRAIDELNYSSACKTALQFNTRFWEKGDKPIVGGCDNTDSYYGIRNVCYPSYGAGNYSDEPGVILSSYDSGDDGRLPF